MYRLTFRFALAGLFAAIMLLSNNVLAADLSITVKQRGTGSAVAGAVIVLDETEIYTETNTVGHAEFQNEIGRASCRERV